MTSPLLQAKPQVAGNRAWLPHMDGLRGLAMVWVVLYHAYVRWPQLVPYGNRFADVPLVAIGWLAVPLFFVQSGYLITRTMYRCDSLADFFARRWSRLFPAMAMCSALLFLTAPLFPERPQGQPSWLDLLPGLTFVDDAWWSKVLGQRIKPMEGSFWTMYVEIKFYVAAALLHRWRGERAVVVGLGALFFVGVLLWLGTHRLGLIESPRIEKLMVQGSLLHFGWFALGALFCFCERQGRGVYNVWSLLLAAVSSFVVAEGVLVHTLCGLVLCVAFAASLHNRSVQRVLSNRVFCFLGFVSYPLYLLHENILVSTLIKLGRIAPSAVHPFLPFVVFVGLMSVAYPIARFFEPWAESLLRSRLFRRAKSRSR